MPRVRRIPKHRRGVGHQHLFQLRVGHDYFGDAFGNGDSFDEAFAREAWEQYRDQILAEWITKRPGTRPWAWWEFDAPEEPRRDEAQYDYLDRLCLLTRDERAVLSERYNDDDGEEQGSECTVA